MASAFAPQVWGWFKPEISILVWELSFSSTYKVISLPADVSWGLAEDVGTMGQIKNSTDHTANCVSIIIFLPVSLPPHSTGVM